MRTTIVAVTFALAFAFALLAPVVARADPPAIEESVESWIQLGLGLEAPREPGLRGWLESERDFAGRSVATGDWKDGFPAMVAPRVELAARVGPDKSVGISSETFRGEVRNLGVGTGPDIWQGRLRQRFVDYAVHAALWPRRWKGGYAGLRVGRGRGTIDVRGSGVLGGDPNVRTDVSGSWSAWTTTWGAYAGWQSTWEDNPRVDIRAGWNVRDLGVMNGGAWTGPSGPASGPPRDFQGRPVDADFSGPYVTLGFVFRSGVKP
jgi:hypothetical protein